MTHGVIGDDMMIKICPVGVEPEDEGEGWRVQLYVHSSIDARFLMAHLGKELALSFPERSPADVLDVVVSRVVGED